MIGDKRVLAVITARGGSKGLPRKNILDVGGKPMVAWNVEAGKGSRYVDRLILSSDDDEIIAAAKSAGCDVPFKRPATLATDEIGIQDTLIHALDTLGEPYDYLVLLQATSPLRIAADIDGALELCDRTGAPGVASVTVASKAPYWMFQLAADGGMRRMVEPPGKSNRRQEFPTVYALNGAVYVVRVAWFREALTFVTEQTQAWIMPPERSVDIDTRMDLLLARALIAETAAAATP
ncbi:MAG: acylneuraminate cytidylyltransferase family protein [Magnetospirillum sp.]|nr:acylneuraminate cytidylyltransferase family protein [Magnetospirillum sp.]